MATETATPGKSQSWPPAGQAWYAVSLLCVAYTFSYIDRQILSLLIEPIRADMGLSDTQIGLLGGIAFALFYTTLGIPIARAADRYSRKFIIIAGVACWSVATAMCGLAKSFTGLFMSRVLVGVGEASLSPASFSMISDYFPPSKMGRAMSVYSLGAALGIGFAFLLGGAVLQVVASLPPVELPVVGVLRPWQIAFIAVGAPGLLVALLLLTIREPARRLAPVADGGLPVVEKSASFAEIWQFMKARAGVLAAVIGGMTLYQIAANGILIWLPAHFVRTLGWTPPEIGYAFGGAMLTFGVAGMYTAGWAGDRLKGGNRVERYFRLMAIWGLLSAPLLSLVPLMPNGWMAMMVFLPGAFLTTGPAIFAPTVIQLFTPNRMRAQVSAIYLFIIALLGMGLGPVIVGLLTDYVYGDPSRLGWSIATLGFVTLPLSALLLYWGALKARNIVDSDD